MKAGKHTCEVLKSIRKQIADSNGIAYTPSECTFSGECMGTCPNCERERQYLERQLSLKVNTGKMLKIIGVAAGLTSMVACQEVKAQDSQANENPQAFKWDFYDMTMGHMPGPPDYYETQLREMVEFISEFPEDIFQVVGHTDSRGSEQFNLKLSQKFADHLRGDLIARGVDPSRIIAFGKGESDPVLPDAKEEFEHAVNRRLTLEFFPSKRREKLDNKIYPESSKSSSKDSLSRVLEEDSIYENGQVDERPQFPGGAEALELFLRIYVRYPADFEGCIKGRVNVSFVVEKDGSISNVEVLRGLHSLVDAEAVRVIKAMPKWIPAKHKGRVVRCRSVVPVLFRLY
ncbi:MAG: TonB family protein [Paludibacteraceae bacterium]|nr:TonB family protein [Paludibacteraceae bacterium]